MLKDDSETQTISGLLMVIIVHTTFLYLPFVNLINNSKTQNESPESIQKAEIFVIRNCIQLPLGEYKHDLIMQCHYNALIINLQFA